MSQCYAVVYSNYHPLEVDSLWSDEKDAQVRAVELGGDPWMVIELEIRAHAPAEIAPTPSENDYTHQYAQAAPEFPKHCDLCEKQIESIDDQIEWHGLGNCVEICERCTGSGVEPSGAAAAQPLRELEIRADEVDNLIGKYSQVLPNGREVVSTDHLEERRAELTAECERLKGENQNHKL